MKEVNLVLNQKGKSNEFGFPFVPYTFPHPLIIECTLGGNVSLYI